MRRYKPQNKIKTVKLRINHQIRIPMVRVIDEEGENLGEMPTQKALALALERELDLIEVAPNLKPPVCKIMDYGKFLYSQEKKARLQRAKSKQNKSEVKGIRITFRASEHDLGMQAKKAEEFLEQGNKVKVEMRLKGREKYRKDMTEQKFRDFLNMIETETEMETELKRMGASIISVLTKK